MIDKRFNGVRLKEALQFRGMKLSDLAEMTDISKQSLSLYSNGENNPPFSNVVKIAKALDFPYDFFMTEDMCTVTTGNTYFRSQASATKRGRKAQIIKLEYAAKMYEVLLDYVNVPELRLPIVKDIPAPKTLLEADSYESLMNIEMVAYQVRTQWGLGTEPIKDIQYLLQEHGIIVTGFKDAGDKIDAFSQKIETDEGAEYFIIALQTGIKSQARLNFDMAHELGHIILHRWGESNEDITNEELKIREKQANIFAGAFLLPRQSFGSDVRPFATNLEYYKTLKKKWGASIQAMVYRAWQLEIITANQFQYMMRVISKKGWKKREPGDGKPDVGTTLFQMAIDAMLGSGEFDAADLIHAFESKGIVMYPKDLENLMGLRQGTLKVETKLMPFVTLKGQLQN
jgi:Zn-dependent peptidase ImmA (M78 family)/DNA-binding XRE family transcriptional regulator